MSQAHWGKSHTLTPPNLMRRWRRLCSSVHKRGWTVHTLSRLTCRYTHRHLPLSLWRCRTLPLPRRSMISLRCWRGSPRCWRHRWVDKALRKGRRAEKEATLMQMSQDTVYQKLGHDPPLHHGSLSISCNEVYIFHFS